MKEFHEERDQHRHFLVTGDSDHQRAEAGKGEDASGKETGKIL